MLFINATVYVNMCKLLLAWAFGKKSENDIVQGSWSVVLFCYWYFAGSHQVVFCRAPGELRFLFLDPLKDGVI